MADLDDSELPLRVPFIKHEAPKLHPAFSFHGKYDRNTDKFIPTDVPIDRQNPQSQIELSDLQTAIQEFRHSYSDNDAFLTVDLQNYTWENVFAILAEARDHYTAEEKRGIGYLKAIWQKTGRNADKIEPWLDFIPDEYGLNFVRAGIVIILQSASVMKRLKIPNRDREIKPDNPKITLDQIEKLVKNVQDQANRVNELYQILMDETCVESFELQVETQEELHLVNENAYEARRIGNEIVQIHLPAISRQNQQIADGFDQLRDIPKLLRVIGATQEQSIKKISKELLHTEFSNMLNVLLRDQGRYIKEDIVMMEESWLKSENLTVAERLAQEPRFRNWFTAQGSGFLLVEGSDDEHATDAMSFMSFVCLTIIGKLISARRPREVVIYFFCGLHCDQQEGPNFMIRSLVMQVLFALKSRQCLDLGFISNEYFVKGLQDHKQTDLLSVLAALFRQFPVDTTIYCVIDGINSYEGGYPYSFKEEMMSFISELRDLTILHLDMHHYGLMRDRPYSSHQCNLKLLLTSSNTPDLCWDQIVHSGNRVSTGYMS
ncbi:hypothetical protein ACHAQJ_009750 [Trichoderma viride]